LGGGEQKAPGREKKKVTTRIKGVMRDVALWGGPRAKAARKSKKESSLSRIELKRYF